MTLILPRHVVEELNAPPLPTPQTINTILNPLKDFTFTTTRLGNVIDFLSLLAGDDAILMRVERRRPGSLLGDWHIDYRHTHEIEASYEEWT